MHACRCCACLLLYCFAHCLLLYACQVPRGDVLANALAGAGFWRFEEESSSGSKQLIHGIQYLYALQTVGLLCIISCLPTSKFIASKKLLRRNSASAGHARRRQSARHQPNDDLHEALLEDMQEHETNHSMGPRVEEEQWIHVNVPVSDSLTSQAVLSSIARAVAEHGHLACAVAMLAWSLAQVSLMAVPVLVTALIM